MSATGDFIPGDQPGDSIPDAPVVFGIRLTPMILGVLFGVVGLVGALAILLNLVQPEWDRYQQLSSQVAEKEAQVTSKQNLNKQIEDAKKELEATKKKQEDVYALFANEATLNTLLLDINRQIEARNSGLPAARTALLASCPAWVRSNIAALESKENGGVPFVVKSELREFTPEPKVTGVIQDSSYGSTINNKLRRETVNVELEANYDQMMAILRNMERLQPFLVFRNVDANVPKQLRLYEVRGGNVQFLAKCQPETRINMKFQLDALMPLTAADKAKLAPPPATAPPAQ
ncbi:hypothetical protein [Pantanalinema sp. GBBB05]|uniref:hypothetical protein n=1 Tax=Pantanalinema sp. GBBB05 TaxID=2604139 RepID=UPI001D40810C|nr:hypothetical protein [Pantanalinema sp. GBBB05]